MHVKINLFVLVLLTIAPYRYHAITAIGIDCTATFCTDTALSLLKISNKRIIIFHIPM